MRHQRDEDRRAREREERSGKFLHVALHEPDERKNVKKPDRELGPRDTARAPGTRWCQRSTNDDDCITCSPKQIR